MNHKKNNKQQKKDDLVPKNKDQLYESYKKNPDPTMKYEDWIKFVTQLLKI